jgi:hypothetical protein
MLGWPDEKVCPNETVETRARRVFSFGDDSLAANRCGFANSEQECGFLSALSTQPSKTGVTIPATCLTGESFFKLNAPAGQNLYGCTSPNVWTLQSSGGITVAACSGA